MHQRHSAALFHVASAVFFPRVPKNSLAKAAAGLSRICHAAAAPSSWMNDVGSIDRCRTLTDFLTLDDGSEEGEYVASAMRFADQPRRVRSEEVMLHAGEPCYLVSACFRVLSKPAVEFIMTA